MEFGRWLTSLISSQMMMSHLKINNFENFSPKTRNNKVLEFMKDENLWMIASTLDQFNEKTINTKVKQLLNNLDYPHLKISNYNKAVFEVLKYHFKNLKQDTVNSMVFRFFIELFMK